MDDVRLNEFIISLHQISRELKEIENVINEDRKIIDRIVIYLNNEFEKINKEVT